MLRRRGQARAGALQVPRGRQRGVLLLELALALGLVALAWTLASGFWAGHRDEVEQLRALVQETVQGRNLAAAQELGLDAEGLAQLWPQERGPEGLETPEGLWPQERGP